MGERPQAGCNHCNPSQSEQVIEHTERSVSHRPYRVSGGGSAHKTIQKRLLKFIPVALHVDRERDMPTESIAGETASSEVGDPLVVSLSSLAEGPLPDRSDEALIL